MCKILSNKCIKLNENELPEITDELCVGCGQCHHHCKFDVIELIEDERDVCLPILPPDKCKITPKDLDEDDDEPLIDESAISDIATVIEVLEETKAKFTRE
ncbi:MAG: 4Fe-4S binding protein, partial [Candidatus Heimdallarchaeota archaeon]